MIPHNLEQYLDEHHVHYESIPHARTYTAQETAASAHLSGWMLAKTVMVRIDERLAMVVLPAPAKVDLDRIQRATGADEVELADEREFRDLFPECEVGAMPPFGNLYNMDVWVDKSLTQDREIAFNAGSHVELIKMAFKDYADLVHPKILEQVA